jgi:hypothetical protein
MKILFTAAFAVAVLYCYCQPKKTSKEPGSVSRKDSTILDIEQSMTDNIPVITLNDASIDNQQSQNISSVLTAGRDLFLSAAAFNFIPVRFKIRGYDANMFSTFINGAPVENLENGTSAFGLWSGLNEVMRNRDVSIGLRANTFSFGAIGSAINIDARAGKQRKQTEIGYAISNRNYTNKISATHNTGFNKKGWAFSISASRRWANQGYYPGTYYDGWSYFIAADKRINKKNIISLIALGALTQNAKQSVATQEAQDLANDHFYNPDWGYQENKKRNANLAKVHQPVIILSHEYRITNTNSLFTTCSFSTGNKGSSYLDWYNVSDPRPDYYRKLPSYYKNNSTAYIKLLSQWQNDESTRQINWGNLYATNTLAKETFNGTTGYRSRYILSEAVNNATKFNFNTTYNARISNNAEFTAGLTYQFQLNRFYKRILDLLGGDYYVDLNQFAERSFPANPDAAQPDLNNTNRVVHVGDTYQYDYSIHSIKTLGWAQSVFKFKKTDYFIAAELSHTQFSRTGNMKNGLFPNNSLGRSSINSFTNYAIKTGVTFKINGRNYLYANAALLTKAPYYDNVYYSPRTRSDAQNNITSEDIKSAEGGYVLNANILKLRFTGYYTEISHQLNILSFYHDSYQNLVNYAISNISKQFFGIELGLNAKVTKNLSVDAAASVGRFYYNSNQFATIILDNDASVLSSDTVYVNGYHLGNTPQNAYSFGINYRSPDNWFISLTGNYFDGMFIDINPIKHTYKAIENTASGSVERNAILAQQPLNSQYTVDLYAGHSWKLSKKRNSYQKNTILSINAGINNLLNNINIISGGFEQLRFDFQTSDNNKFPSKYYYAFGTNYFISSIIRF